MNIQRIQTLHFEMIATIGKLSVCKAFNDQWGIRYYSRKYDKLKQRLSELPNLEHSESCLTDEEADYVLNDGPKPELSKDMKVTDNGFHFFTPESE